MKKMCVAAWLGALVVSGTALAQEEGAPSFPKLTGGGEFRLRFEQFDHVPIKADPPGETRGGLNSYIRFRTRLWTQFDLNENVGVYARGANEFRHYYEPDNSSWDFPDEVVMDNLYLDVRKLLDDSVSSASVARICFSCPVVRLAPDGLSWKVRPRMGRAPSSLMPPV